MRVQRDLFSAANAPNPRFDRVLSTTHVGLLFTAATFYAHPDNLKGRGTVGNILQLTE